jgi:hypothetical protein
VSDSIDSKLGFGPMSPEIIEGIVKASYELKEPFMLIGTKNQIDWSGGYVNNWTTKQYVEFVREKINKYKGSRIYFCRDHCGPGFKDNNIKDVFRTIDDDIENGFDLIHIDFSKISKTKEIILEETKKAIEYILRKNEKIKLEIGTEENTGSIMKNLSDLSEELKIVMKITKPEFYVINTGSLTRETTQIGCFYEDYINKAHIILSNNGIKLKEHNADYLDKDEINKRKKIVDALNIAPQLGVIQTLKVINEAHKYGLKTENFLDCCYKSQKWKKWLYKNTKQNKMLCSIIAGHYNFMSEEYKELISRLEKHINIKELIIEEILSTIKFIFTSFK